MISFVRIVCFVIIVGVVALFAGFAVIGFWAVIR